MDDAWQSDIAPSNGGISIPTHENGVNNGAAMVTDEPTWSAKGNSRSPGRDRNGDPPRRSSRSRSPGGRGRQADGGQNPGNNLYVSGLSHKVDTRDLEAAFAKVGRVKKASVTYDPHTRESRGFGFVTMETGEEAEAAITALNSTELMGKVCTVEKARRARARTPTPGRYYGPPKRAEHERPYDPRPYDSRYTRDFDDRRRGRYDDNYGGGGGGRGGGSGGGGGRDHDRSYRDYDRDRGGGDRSYRDNRDYDRRYDDRRY